jgi:hypothetical protein
MPILTIRWQRLLNAKGQTCPRCGGTQLEVERAVQDLKMALRPLDIQVRFERKSLTWRAFRRNPAASNRIWVGGKPLELWLGGREGRSRCCGACGETACRTVKVGRKSYETIPSRLIVSAGLRAAARLMEERFEHRPVRGKDSSTKFRN